MTRIIHAEPALTELAPQDRGAWEAWFAAHGVDTMDVPVGVDIEIDDAARTISYEGWLRDEVGRVLGDTGSWKRERKSIKLDLPIAPTPGSGLKVTQ